MHVPECVVIARRGREAAPSQYWSAPHTLFAFALHSRSLAFLALTSDCVRPQYVITNTTEQQRSLCSGVSQHTYPTASYFKIRVVSADNGLALCSPAQASAASTPSLDVCTAAASSTALSKPLVTGGTYSRSNALLAQVSIMLIYQEFAACSTPDGQQGPGQLYRC